MVSNGSEGASQVPQQCRINARVNILTKNAKWISVIPKGWANIELRSRTGSRGCLLDSTQNGKQPLEGDRICGQCGQIFELRRARRLDPS